MALENLPEAVSDLKPHRKRHNLEIALMEIKKTLRSAIRKYSAQRGLLNHPDEVDQHAMMAIMKALRSWDPEKGAYSTHVHWQIRGEMTNVAHQLIPEHRKVKTPLPVIKVSMDTLTDSAGEPFSMHDIIPDNRAEADLSNNASYFTMQRHLDRIFSHYLAAAQLKHDKACDTPKKRHEACLIRMRDRDMFLRCTLQDETLESIKMVYGVSRERVRQIVKRVTTEIADYLPQNGEDPVIETPPSYHAAWDEHIIAFFVETGVDTRLVSTELDLHSIDRIEALTALANDNLNPMLPNHDENVMPATVVDLAPRKRRYNKRQPDLFDFKPHLATGPRRAKKTGPVGRPPVPIAPTMFSASM